MDIEQVKKELKKFLGERVLFYIKFTSREDWAKDLLNGNLFMNKVQYYRDLEANTGVKGQGDLKELKTSIEDLDLQLKNEENNIIIPMKAKSLEFEYSEDKDKPVFCITGITIDDMKINSFDEKSVSLSLPYSKDDIELLKSEFGEYVVVLNPQKFEQAIGRTLDTTNKAWIFGKVMYRGKNSLDRIQSFSDNTGKRFLYKDLEFKHQKEYRLVIDENIESTKILSIGNLEDAGNAMKVEDFISNIDITINLK
ncbi:hypothetical protein [Paraclostridium sordellii]|uniref:hypothetical protein n=1 Tax=Paraclostridium sordellii TaxID=1505 RepID=UPI001F055197|nr:hypothetical protein [Paeniclostridium sordellii]MCH1966194.1 hypothetical protein [Paeniclostridium sordellii]